MKEVIRAADHSVRLNAGVVRAELVIFDVGPFTGFCDGELDSGGRALSPVNHTLMMRDINSANLIVRVESGRLVWHGSLSCASAARSPDGLTTPGVVKSETLESGWKTSESVSQPAPRSARSLSKSPKGVNRFLANCY